MLFLPALDRLNDLANHAAVWLIMATGFSSLAQVKKLQDVEIVSFISTELVAITLVREGRVYRGLQFCG